MKGDMALIGPRPALTYHPWSFDQYTEEQKHMFDVRPGVTGWAQVNGRKEVPWQMCIRDRGIANQVHAALLKFCSNFIVAVKPQIIKSYAQKDIPRMHSLILFSSKMTVYLTLVMIVPLLSLIHILIFLN